MATAYRIHSADEPLETLLNPRRPDGWVASDEDYDSQPLGVSCCRTIGDLMRYARKYSMRDGPSLLVELTGEWSGESDRDEHADRMIVTSYRVIGHGDRLVRWAQDYRGEWGAKWQ